MTLGASIGFCLGRRAGLRRIKLVFRQNAPFGDEPWGYYRGLLRRGGLALSRIKTRIQSRCPLR
jgi:hypothetical protein